MIPDVLSGLDEDGILLDDDEPLSRYSLQRADSGFGTVERKSTSSRYRDNPDFDLDFGADVKLRSSGFKADSLTGGNISDFEASDSQGEGSTPRDADSLDSSIEPDDPSVFDLSPRQRRPRRKHRFHSNDDILDSDTSYTKAGSDRSLTSIHNRSRELLLDRDKNNLFQSIEFTEGRQSYDTSFNQVNAPENERPASQNSSISYLLQNKKSERVDELEALKEMDPLFAIPRDERVRVTPPGHGGESIFTQDDTHEVTIYVWLCDFNASFGVNSL